LGTLSGNEWILPAVIATGWVLSWWGPRRIRWVLLPTAAVICVLCIVFGALDVGRGAPTVEEMARMHEAGVTFYADQFHCSPYIACMDQYPVYWMMAGLIGFVCCVALMLVTSVVDAVTWSNRRASARDV
jgi:hypothetical protein